MTTNDDFRERVLAALGLDEEHIESLHGVLRVHDACEEEAERLETLYSSSRFARSARQYFPRRVAPPKTVHESMVDAASDVGWSSITIEYPSGGRVQHGPCKVSASDVEGIWLLSVGNSDVIRVSASAGSGVPIVLSVERCDAPAKPKLVIANEDTWVWSDAGGNNINSFADDAKILITARQLRELIQP